MLQVDEYASVGLAVEDRFSTIPGILLSIVNDFLIIWFSCVVLFFFFKFRIHSMKI